MAKTTEDLLEFMTFLLERVSTLDAMAKLRRWLESLPDSKHADEKSLMLDALEVMRDSIEAEIRGSTPPFGVGPGLASSMIPKEEIQE